MKTKIKKSSESKKYAVLENGNFLNNQNYILGRKEKRNITMFFENIYIKNFIIENLALYFGYILILLIPSILLSAFIWQIVIGVNNNIYILLGIFFILNLVVLVSTREFLTTFTLKKIKKLKLNNLEQISFYIFFSMFFFGFFFMFFNVKGYKIIYKEKVDINADDNNNFLVYKEGINYIIEIKNFILVRKLRHSKSFGIADKIENFLNKIEKITEKFIKSKGK